MMLVGKEPSIALSRAFERLGFRLLESTNATLLRVEFLWVLGTRPSLAKGWILALNTECDRMEVTQLLWQVESLRPVI